MNAERLLTHYERIADAPDAIARLRQTILCLAVRGKLVPQDPNDEPAINFDRAIPHDLERPFRIPRSWFWARLHKLGKLKGGGTPSKARDDFWNGAIPWVSPKDMKVDYISEAQMRISEAAIAGSAASLIDAGSILFVVRGMILAHSFPVAVSLAPLSINQDMKALTLKQPEMGEYILRALKGTKLEMLKRVQRSSHGTCRLEGSDYNDFLIPIPPLAEQLRIVAMVDELMGLCDRLEAARAGREATRDRLAAVSLARLNAPDPNAFRDDVRFALDALPALTTRPDQIKRLRQTILNLAVRGKLVPQDPNDEPASELVKRIAKEKARLVKLGGIKKEKEQQPTRLASRPFELPETWLWARFADIAAVQSNLVDPRGYKNHPHIAPDNIESGTGRLLPYDSIANAGVFSAKHLFKPGCILYSKIRPALAKVVLADFEGLCSADMYPLLPFIDRQYLQKFMLTEAFVRQSVSEDNRVAMPKINQEALAKISVAVPPLAEQHRIVAKVDALMALCDRLEASLDLTAATRRRLLDALLAEALAPVNARELEAAE